MKFISGKLLSLMQADKRLGKDIAREGGFSPSALSQWAAGERTPGANELASIARVFGVPLEYFFEPKDLPKRTPYLRTREGAEESSVDEALRELEGLKEKVQSLERAVRRLKPKALPASSRAAYDAKRVGAKGAASTRTGPGE